MNTICGKSKFSSVYLAILGIAIVLSFTTFNHAFASVSISLSSDRTSIDRGTSVTLNWDSNGSYCRAPWTGNINGRGVQIVSPVETTTYNITCTNDSGTNSASVTVTINSVGSTNNTNGVYFYPIPRVSLTASPSFIPTPGNVVLSWNSANATTCFSPWLGSSGTYGSQTVYADQTTSYSVVCNGYGGSERATVSVFVGYSPSTNVPPTNVPPANVPATGNSGVGLVANQNRVTSGAAVNLFWASVGTDYCSAPWTSSKSTSGRDTVYPLVTTTYTMTCFRNGQSSSASQTVAVTSGTSGTNEVPTTPKPSPSTSGSGIVTLFTASSTIKEGEFSILRWNSSNTDKCQAISPDNWTVNTDVSGEQVVYPTQTTTYVIKCSGKNFSDFANVTVVVGAKETAEGESKDTGGLASLLGSFNLSKLFFAVIVLTLILGVALFILRRKLPQG